MADMPLVYWFASPDDGVYQDDVATLVDGLTRLGVRVVGSRDYWRHEPDGEFLLQRHPTIVPADADIVVCSWTWLRSVSNDFKVVERDPPEYLHQRRPDQARVLVDLDDGYETKSFSEHGKCFDIVLRSKYNRRCYHPVNHVPWALGLSQRILDALPEQPLRLSERRNAAIAGFGASHGFAHGTRAKFTDAFCDSASRFLEIDKTQDDLSIAPATAHARLMWNQTQRRHCPAYYERLATTQVVAAFCGDMIPPAPRYPKYLAGGRKAQLKRLCYSALGTLDRRPPRSIQWDSWRFWEGLAAGCLVFNIDLDYYGVELPVMPINGVHYVGLRYETIESQVHEVLSDADRMAAIAEHGRSWAYEHYSSVGLAKQFLKLVGAQPN